MPVAQAADPAIRWIVGEKAVSGRGASASQMGRFETKWLAVGKNLSALADLSGGWIENVHVEITPVRARPCGRIPENIGQGIPESLFR
jgi:hypothetical protein